MATTPSPAPAPKRTWLLLVLAIPGILLATAVAAGIIATSMRPLVIFSAIDGQLARGGEPVAGMTLTRTWYWPWGQERGSDTAITDSDGRFTFPSIERKGFFARFLPHEPSIMQRINAQDEEDEIEIWATTKHSYEPKGEFGRVPSSISRLPVTAVCDLASEPAHAGSYQYPGGNTEPDSAIYGRCAFPNEVQ